jgi:hypothetical protein
MAVYKIFPEKDATMYSLFPNMNTGMDEIIEATETVFAYSDPNPQTSRFLIKFSNDDLNYVLGDLVPDNIYNSGSWKANLQCYIATSTGMNATTTLECYPVSGSWDMGTGRYLDVPSATNGVSWIWRKYSGSVNGQWSTVIASLGTGVTASYNISYSFAGGGTWYTGSPNLSLFNSNTNPITQSVEFTFYGSKDLNLNVTNTLKAWSTGAFDNNGFILKQEDEFIDNKDIQPELKYFSRDTHTIYPPALQISWFDFSFNTGSSTQTVLNTTPATLTLAQNPGTFYPESINRFRINARPEYPLQIWETSSVYLNNYYLPSGSSLYAIKDLDTNEYVIDFDSQYTQISADATSSYFDVYMNGLEPERYYAILIQTNLNGSKIVFDNQYYFKVING